MRKICLTKIANAENMFGGKTKNKNITKADHIFGGESTKKIKKHAKADNIFGG